MSARLMAVEDDQDMQFLVSVVLSADRRLEFQGGAVSAEDGVAMARELQPDLIILDHFIEGDTMGLQAAPLLKAAAPNARILLFTTHDLAIEAKREAAIDGYLAKDQLPELLGRVQDLLHLDPDPAA